MELFVPNALQTVVQFIGGEDLPCFKRDNRRRARASADWRHRPLPAIGPTGAE
jgi:hypothetical protein